MLASMYKKVKVVEKSSSLKVSTLKDYKHTETLTKAIAYYQELQNICLSYPFYFSQDENGIIPVVLLGTKDKNVYLLADGQWRENTYIPAVCHTYPIGLSKDPESDNYVLVHDSEYDGLNKKDGKLVIDTNGELTDFGKKFTEFLQEFQLNIIKTQKVLKVLIDYNLIKNVNIKATIEGEEQVIESIGIVDEEKLKALSDEEKLNLVNLGVYRIIDMHLLSLKHLSLVVSQS
jgi:hypothetical protein